MRLSEEIFEDESVGIEGEESTSHGHAHHGGHPQHHGGFGQKSTLPKGSETFQQVLLEIQKEKEDAEVDKLGQLKAVSDKIKDSSTNDNHRKTKGSMWKVASMKLFKRTKSQRELLKR